MAFTPDYRVRFPTLSQRVQDILEPKSDYRGDRCTGNSVFFGILDPPPQPTEADYQPYKGYAPRESTISFTTLGIPLPQDGTLPFPLTPTVGFGMLQKIIHMLMFFNIRDYADACLAERAITALLALTHSHLHFAARLGIPNNITAPLIFDLGLALATLWELRSKLTPTDGSLPIVKYCTCTAVQAWEAIKFPVKTFMSLSPKWGEIINPNTMFNSKVVSILGFTNRQYTADAYPFIPRRTAYTVLANLHYVIRHIEKARNTQMDTDKATLPMPEWFKKWGRSKAQTDYDTVCRIIAIESRKRPRQPDWGSDRQASQATTPSQNRYDDGATDRAIMEAIFPPEGSNSPKLPPLVARYANGKVVERESDNARRFAYERNKTRTERGEAGDYVAKLPAWAPDLSQRATPRDLNPPETQPTPVFDCPTPVFDYSTPTHLGNLSAMRRSYEDAATPITPQNKQSPPAPSGQSPSGPNRPHVPVGQGSIFGERSPV